MPAYDDCVRLLNFVMPVAEQCLRRYGGFYPFGAAMLPNGEIAQVVADNGLERGPAQPLVDMLEAGFREFAEEGRYIATALAYDSLTIPPGESKKRDAVAVKLDHRDEYSVIVLVPYTIHKSRIPFQLRKLRFFHKKPTLEKSFHYDGDYGIFSQSASRQ